MEVDVMAPWKTMKSTTNRWFSTSMFVFGSVRVSHSTGIECIPPTMPKHADHHRPIGVLEKLGNIEKTIDR